MNQESFEYFVNKYGEPYESLRFFKCQLISDFSPLSRLKNLKAVYINWNIRTDKLWDMWNNTSLIHPVMRIVKNHRQSLPASNGKNLKTVAINGSMFKKFQLDNLSNFENTALLECINLRNVKPENRNLDFLKTLPHLSEFNFDAGMFTTEEIAYMCAR